MPNYDNGCIYMLRHKDDVELQNIYIGSTTNFRGRKYEHKQSCNNVNNKEYNYQKYQYIRANGGWDNWKMIWIEDYPCKSKKELLKREDEVMLQYENRLNRYRAHTTDEEKKQRDKEYSKEYRQDNREKILEQQKEHYQNNRDKIIENKKEHYQNNRDKIIEYQKEHYQNNRDKIIENKKEYYQNNREKVLEYKKEKITCDICGCKITRGNMPEHQRSTKCQSHKMST